MESSGGVSCYNADPTWNLKCIVFTLVLAGGYWFLPKRNKWILLGLLYFPYIVLAWYDYYYICERNMGPTYLSLFYWWAKPPESKQIIDYKNWCPDKKNWVFFVDIIILMIAIAISPFFINWKVK